MIKMNKEKKSLVIFLVIVFLIIGLFGWVIIDIGIDDHNKMRLCGNELGYECSWLDCEANNYITTEYINENITACCLKEKFITSEGVLADKKCVKEVSTTNKK